MHKNADQRSIPAVLKKIARGDPIEGLESFVEQNLPSGCPPGQRLDELIRCFMLVRESSRHGPHQTGPPMARFARALATLADKAGIPPEHFYTGLLDRIMGEADADEPVRAQSKIATKQKILEAALEVFSSKGFHTATMDEVAERAGVGKGTLYRYFETKEKLFGELVRLRLGELEDKAGSILDGRDDVLTLITKYIRLYFEFFDRNQQLYRLIVQERLDLGEQSPDIYFKKVLRAIPNLKRKVYEASQQGILKDAVDFQTVFYGSMGFVHGVIQKWLARDCSYPLAEELPGVLEVLFYGFVEDQRPKQVRSQTHRRKK